MSTAPRSAIVLLALAVATPTGSVAQDTSPLEALDAAAERLDFPAVLVASEHALASGLLGPAELVHVYQQQAMAESFGANAPSARTAYERMLAIDPQARPDDSVPPRLQSPYVEALRARDRLRVSASVSTAGHAVHVHVDDGVGMIARVVFVYDLGLGTEPAELAAPPSADVTFQIPERVSGTIRYRVSLHDRFGNRWFELGSIDAPRVASISTSPIPGTSGREADDAPRSRFVRSPWLWVGIGALVVGIGVGVGLAHDRPVRAITGITF